MPTYEYGCDACGNQWELEQRISEDPVKKCPKCGKKKARRMISGGNFILKGSGWYADLYHKPSSKSASSSESSGAAKSEAKSDSASSPSTPSSPSTTSESKPAKKAANE